MDIKVGDVVKVHGRKERITRRSVKYVTLSHTGTMPIDYIEQFCTMAQPIVLPKLNVGDLVYVHNITDDEKNNYYLEWWSEKDQYIDKIWPVTYIRDVSDIVGGGQIATLGDGQGFHTYHLEKIDDYDIV